MDPALRTLPVVDLFDRCLRRSYERARALLFPFKAGVWLRLLVFFFLAGGSGGQFRIPTLPSTPNSVPPVVSGGAPGASTKPSMPSSTRQLKEQFERGKATLQTLWKENRVLVLGVLTAVVIMGLLIGLLLMWIVCRMQMGLLQALESGQVRIRQSVRETRDLGESLFRFQLGVAACALIPALLLAVGGYFFWKHGPHHLPPAVVVALVISIVVAVPLIVVGLCLYVGIVRFLPVVMFVRNENALSALLRCLRFFRRNVGRTLGLGALYVLLTMVVGMAFLMLIALIFVPIGIFAAVLIPALLHYSHVATVLLVSFGAVVAVVGVAALAIVSVPVQTFSTYLRLTLVQALSVPPQPAA